MDTLITALQFILALSILITLHEFGHYWAARAFGIRIEKFYLFFDAWNFKLFSFKRGDTEYGIGWLPLGGYVKIAGMVDESLDTEQMKSEPQPWEFRSKPAWQRLIVMIGGVTVNLILGIVIMITLTYSQGEKYVPQSMVNEQGGIYAGPVARSVGFQIGDQILSINGVAVDNLDAQFGDPSFLTADRKEIGIRRKQISPITYTKAGDTETAQVTQIVYDTTLVMPSNFDELLGAKSDMPFFAPRMKFKIGKVMGGSHAEKAGLDVGDKIEYINGEPVFSFFEFKEMLVKHAGETVKMQVSDSTNKTSTLKAEIGEDATLGFQPVFYGFEYQEKVIKYGLGKSINLGVSRSFGLIGANAKALGNVATGKTDPTKSLAGPIGIAQMFGSSWNWLNFWTLTAMLSLVLALMNILPIPALDGGHVMFLLYEIIARRPVSDKVLYVGQIIGMVFLLSLVAFTFWVDIARALGI
ncbi:MAG: RIP metalloprotease RseP [Bacteroidota bacterium]|jgi:regulator of sigma E protease|nr:RIP metalloprotease RseP [Bacteroidota bacterium]